MWHRAALDAVQRLVPHARVLHALAGVALADLRQVEPGAEVRALAVEHRRAHRAGQVLEGVAQREDQPVVERVALGRAGQADDGDVVLDVEAEVGVRRHDCSPCWNRLWL